jgi:peptidoglycan/LPS O-acetylase OafA/YrhL
MAQGSTGDHARGRAEAGRAGREPGHRRSRRRWLDPRDNSLNLIRLLLALAVLVSHAFAIAGLPEPTLADKHLGSWAVIGFFVISGYLITGSRLRSDGARYLINRVARIFPGFVVSLVVVAFGFAPVAYVVQNGGLDGFLTTGTTPLAHVYGNLTLRISDYSVAGTLADVPYPNAWNGSLWSLYYEFLCYIVVGVVGGLAVVRRRAWPMVVLFAASVLVYALLPQLLPYLGGTDLPLLFELLPYFLGGAVVFVLKERLSLRAPAALGALAAGCALILVGPVWAGQLTAPLFTYGILWVAAAVRVPQVLQVHDLSYGVYVYAFPVTQLLVLAGVHRHGVLLLIAAATAVTVLVATASWFLVERPARDAAARRRVAPPRVEPVVTGRAEQLHEVSATPVRGGRPAPRTVAALVPAPATSPMETTVPAPGGRLLV